MPVAGHVTKEQEKRGDVTIIGISFDKGIEEAVAFIERGEEGMDLTLTMEEVGDLLDDVRAVYRAMEWHRASWVRATGRGTSLRATIHLMQKGQHDKHGKTLCGHRPSKWDEQLGGWSLSPLRGEPDREKNKYVGGTCRRCLAAYDRAVAHAARKREGSLVPEASKKEEAHP